jgi:ATP-dependent DNA ligase
MGTMRSAPLPRDLAGPVTVALAKAAPAIPEVGALPGGCVYELKWDGFRLVVVTTTTGSRLWTRQGTDLTDRFPEIVATATAVLPVGSVVDGELVVFDGTRLSFSLLQQRMVRNPGDVRRLAAAHPASFVAFDLLAEGGVDLRRRPFTDRRAALEQVVTWVPPLQLSPTTTDPAVARAWMDDFRPAGLEGVMVKAAAGAYHPGARDWLKVKRRDTHEVIVGAITGTLTHPTTIIAGLYRGGELVVVGRTVPLTTTQSAELGAVLDPAGTDHPWPARISSGRFGGRSTVPTTRADPVVVAEVSADSARENGVWRHGLRYHRHRPDLTPHDLPEL